jgi:HNH endonuclease
MNTPLVVPPVLTSKTVQTLFAPGGRDQKYMRVALGHDATSRLRYEQVCRLALWCYVGPPPHVNMVCMHLCDNPCCINPKHLYWGTYSDNAYAREANKKKRKLGDDGAKLRELYNKLMQSVWLRGPYARNHLTEFHGPPNHVPRPAT